MTRFAFCAIPPALLCLSLSLCAPLVAQEQPSRPHTDTLSELRTNDTRLREFAERAKQQTLVALQSLGGRAAERAQRLASLPPSKVIERLAVDPAAGPSTIAAPRPGTTVPVASINWVGDKGGATTGHPGVVLLLAKPDGDDTYKIFCSGTLIRQNVVLTATHCVCYSKNPTANYRTGSLCLNGDTAAPSAPSVLLDPNRWLVFFQHLGLRALSRVEIDNQYEFGDSRVRNDLALMVLAKPVTQINPSPLPAASDTAGSWTSGAIVGFGYSSNTSLPGITLKELVLPGIKAQGEVSSAPCAQEVYLDPQASMCSRYQLGSNGSQSTVCGGDSGGPLWNMAPTEMDIGVTSGRNNEDCMRLGTLAFQMSTSYTAHWQWINQHASQYASQPVKGRWPAFGENLLYVVDRRNANIFDKRGRYESDGWMTLASQSLILATMNSSGEVTDFQLQTRDGRTLCRGVAGSIHQTPNVDYCWATIAPNLQFRVVASGKAGQYLQFVVTRHPDGTSFDL